GVGCGRCRILGGPALVACGVRHGSGVLPAGAWTTGVPAGAAAGAGATADGCFGVGVAVPGPFGVRPERLAQGGAGRGGRALVPGGVLLLCPLRGLLGPPPLPGGTQRLADLGGGAAFGHDGLRSETRSASSRSVSSVR